MKYYQVKTDFYHEEALRSFVQECDLNLEKEMERVAREIASHSDLRLLGLTGPTCAGKTTAANKLTDYLEAHGHHVHVISIDDFFFETSILRQMSADDPNGEIDYDSEDTIDMPLLEEKIASLLSYRETRLPHFDFKTGMRTEGVLIRPRRDDVFLFEGIQILYPKVHAILNSSAYRSIYICPLSALDVSGQRFEPNELRLMRRLVRDYRYRATEPDFTLYLWQSVRKNEEKNIFPNAHRCHEVIDSTMPYEVGMLKPYLEDILPRVKKESQFYAQAQQILEQIAQVPAISSDFMTQNSLYKEFI